MLPAGVFQRRPDRVAIVKAAGARQVADLLGAADLRRFVMRGLGIDDEYFVADGEGGENGLELREQDTQVGGFLVGGKYDA